MDRKRRENGENTIGGMRGGKGIQQGKTGINETPKGEGWNKGTWQKGEKGGKGTVGGKGPTGGCFDCGGPHYASACPYKTPYGNNAVKTYNLNEWWPNEGEGQEQISYIGYVKRREEKTDGGE